MVRSNNKSTHLGARLYFTPTDTTVGFVSQDASKIDRAKRRLPNKHYIRTVDSLATLKRLSRVPQAHKNRLRRAQRTTFIFPNFRSFRLVRGTPHNLLLNRIGWLYSSSANESGKEYSPHYAKRQAEVLVSIPPSLREEQDAPSAIYRLSFRNQIRIR